jgi:site-specific DNA-methyltransferase (adenine-specific)
MRLLQASELPAAISLDDDLVIEADAATVLGRLPDGAFELIYIDPPFNTGRSQRLRSVSVERDDDAGTRAGFAGKRYRQTVRSEIEYPDSHEDYEAFLQPKLERSRELLSADGTLYVHLDYREAHYVKVALDRIFGRECFLNEIVWAYDYGGKPKKRWPAKHDTVLVYVRDPARYIFDSDAVEREPYMAPGLVGPEKAARGKRPTDVWWHTIVPTNGAERTGYPTQKPEGVLRRIVAASSRPDGWCLDFFAGSGTLGAVASQLGRRYVLIDRSPEAIAIARARLTR